MRITPKFNVRRFQEGGAMAPEEEMPQEAPMEGGGGQLDPMAMLIQGAAQALQGQDCNMAMQVCQMLIQLVQGAQGGGGEAPQGEPVFRRGGILKRIKR